MPSDSSDSYFPRIRFWSLPTLFVILGCSLLTSLGVWQTRRGLSKLEIEREQQQRKGDAELVASSLTELQSHELNFRKARLTGRLNLEHLFVVEHRIRDGAPGVWLIGLLELADGGSVVINRGWVHRRNRQEVVEKLAGRKKAKCQTWSGMLHQPKEIVADDTARRSVDTLASASAPIKLETFDLAHIYELVPGELVKPPTVLLLDDKHSTETIQTGYKSVQEPYLTADRHFGYATFWFAVDVALIAMYLAYGAGALSYGGRGRS